MFPFHLFQSLSEDWAGSPGLSDGQQYVAALLVEQPGGDVIPSLRWDCLTQDPTLVATANLQTWIRAVLFETPTSPPQFPCSLSAMPVLASCCVCAKLHWAGVDEDPCWCQVWSPDGQSSLSSPLVRASPGPALCWHLGPSSSYPSLVFPWEPCRVSYCEL